MKRAPFASIASLSLMMMMIAAPDHVGAAYYFEATTTVEGAGQSRGGQVSSVQAWVEGPSSRVEFREGDPSGMFAAGTYLLTNDAGETVYVVNPAERTVSKVDLAQILQTVGSLTEATGGLVQMEFSDFTTEKISEGPGETILGYPTTRYQYKTGYTMKVGVLGFARENRADTDQEFFCTDAIDAGGFDIWLRPDRFRTGNASIDGLIEQQYETVRCLPLRQRLVTTMTGQRGRESSTTTTTEVTVLREDDAPAGMFELPSDFETVPLIPDLPAEFGADAPEQAPSEAPKRPRLRDLLNR